MEIFSCGGPRPTCDCGRNAVNPCAFPLRGRKAGQTCGLPLCERCTRPGTRCRIHHELEEKEKAHG